MSPRPSDDELRRLLTSARSIAMVGVSADASRPSHRIMKQLLAAGYHVIPVNPLQPLVLGRPTVAALTDIAEHVDIVDVFRRSELTPAIADDAVTIGAGALWLQLGVSSEEAAQSAAAAGLVVVMDTCIGATHTRLQIPPLR